MVPPLSPRSAGMMRTITEVQTSVEQAASITCSIQNDIYRNIFSKILEDLSQRLNRMVKFLEQRGELAFRIFKVEAEFFDEEIRSKIQEMKNTHLQKGDEKKVQVIFDSFLQKLDPIIAHFKTPRPALVVLTSENPDIVKAKQGVLRTLFEQSLERISAILDIHPECFVSYSCGTPEEAQCVYQISQDLKRAGIRVLLNIWEIKAGDDVIKYIGFIRSCSYVLLMVTPEVVCELERRTGHFALELDSLSVKYIDNPRSIVPCIITGEPKFPHFLGGGKNLSYVDFRKNVQYYSGLIDVILKLLEHSKHLEEIKAICEEFKEKEKLIRSDKYPREKLMESLKEIEVQQRVYHERALEEIEKMLKLGLEKSGKQIPGRIDHLELKLTKVLMSHYRNFDTISLFYDEDETLPIQNYAPLLMIRDDERKDERKTETKNSIDLKLLFERENEGDAKGKKIYVLGAAGSGKTTLCQYIAYQWSMGNLWPQFKAIFWIKLRYLSKEFYPKGRDYQAYDLLAGKDLKHRGIELESYSKLLEDKHFCQQMLVVLDGEDELPSEAALGHLSIPFNELKGMSNNLLITSRPQRDLSGDKKKMLTVEIVGFDAESIDKYITHFFADIQKRFAIAEQNLRTYLRQFPIVRSLAHIPLNLAVLCRLFKERENPFDIKNYLTVSCLYENITAWICKRFLLHPSIVKSLYQVSDVLGANSIDLEETQEILSALKNIAWEAMKNDVQYLLEKSAMSYLKNLKLIRQSKSFGLFKIDQGIGSFIHLTFQEFFAALYLADLYLRGKNDERHAFLILHKFTPRYATVFWMVAGYLSTKDETALRAFFHDLLSEPYDLAVGYELKLLARCFEECQDPYATKKYDFFLDKLIDYIRNNDLSAEIKANVLVGNPRLLQHDRLVEFFKESLEKNKSLEILDVISSEKQIIPSRIIQLILDFLQKSNLSFEDCKHVTTFLKRWAMNGQDLFQAGSNHLLSFISDPQINSAVRDLRVLVLKEMARKGEVLSENNVQDLLKLIENPQVDKEVKSDAIQALKELAKSECSLSIVSLEGLFQLFMNPLIQENVSMDVCLNLFFLLRSRKGLFQKATDRLFQLLKDPQAKIQIQKLAVEILVLDESELNMLREAMVGLFIVLRDPNTKAPTLLLILDSLQRVIKSNQDLSTETTNELFNDIENSQSSTLLRLLVINALVKVTIDVQGNMKELTDRLFAFKDNFQIGYGIQGLIAMSLESHLSALKSEQSFSNDFINGLLKFILNTQYNDYVKQHIRGILGPVPLEWVKEENLSEEAIEKMCEFARDSQYRFWYRAMVTFRLVEFIKDQKNRSKHKELEENLVALLKDVEAGFWIRNLAAQGLIELVEKQKELSQEILESLVEYVKNPKLEFVERDKLRQVLKKWTKEAWRKPVTAKILLNYVENSNIGWELPADIIIEVLVEWTKDAEDLTVIVDNLLKLLFDSQSIINDKEQLYIRIKILSVLESLLKSNPNLPKCIVMKLVEKIETPIFGLVDSLERVAISRVDCKDVMEGLVKLLRNQQTDSWLRGRGARAIGILVKNNYGVPPNAIESMVELLDNPQTTSGGRTQAAEGLEAIAKSGHSLSSQALVAICKNFKRDIRFLTSIAEACCRFPDRYEPEVLNELFFLVGRAYYFREGAFYISGHKISLNTRSSEDNKRIYQGLLEYRKLHLLSNIPELMSASKVHINVQTTGKQIQGANPINEEQFNHASTKALPVYKSTPTQGSYSSSSLPLDEENGLSKVKQSSNEFNTITSHASISRKWDETTIATLFWLNPKTLISEEMVIKINFVHTYLISRGFELRGVEADGNCFCSAFWGSYKTLNRKIPLLDDSENKIVFLRGQIAAQYERSPQGSKNGIRVEQIKKDKEWLAALDEGDLLAVALSIPIRLITVNIEDLNCGVSDMLTFTDGKRPRQEWETIPENERPTEFIMIVDVGGHFLYAQKSDKPVPK